MLVMRNFLYSPISLFLVGCTSFALGSTVLGYLEFVFPPIELNELVTTVDGFLVLLLFVFGLSLIGLSLSLLSASLRWPLSKWRPLSFKTLLFKHLLILIIASNIFAFIPLALGRVEIRGMMFPPNQQFLMNEPDNSLHPNDKPSSFAETILRVTVMGIYDAEMSHTANSKVSTRYFTILIILSILLIIIFSWKQNLDRN